MPMETHSFKRLVLGLQLNAADRTMRLAVEVANLLQLELLGLFLEDTSLRDLAGVPFAREFRPLGGGWHPLDPERLLREFEIAADNAERMFVEAAKGLVARYQFEVRRGSTAESFASVSRSGDIVMIAAPASPAERATQQFSWLIEAAFRSAAAVMLVPPHIARAKGPIVAIATGANDPSLEIAGALAMAAKEDLVVVDADQGGGNQLLLSKLASAGLAIRYVAGSDKPILDANAFARIFRGLEERLVVVGRSRLADEAALSIATARRIPVLVVGKILATEGD